MANQYSNQNQSKDSKTSQQNQPGQQHQQGQQGQQATKSQQHQQGQPTPGGKQQGGSGDDRSRAPQGGKDDSLMTNQSSDKR